jgi:hypothetical protein
LSTVAATASGSASENSKKLESGDENVADELINREIKTIAEQISSDVGVSRTKSIKKAKSLLKSKLRLECPKVSTLDAGSFGGFYIGGGVGRNRSGQLMSCEGRRRTFDFEHKLPINDLFFVRLRRDHGPGAGVIGPDDVTDTIAEISRMVTSDDGNVQRVQFIREDGTPVGANDFYKGVAARALAGSTTLVVVQGNNCVIKTELEVKAESIDIDEKKRNTASVVALGFGHVFGDRVYVGLEGMCDFQKDFVSEKQNITIKTSGLRPMSALRLGFLYEEWLFYTKIGAAYARTRIMDNHAFGKFALLTGGGVERRFGNLSFRIDADYVRGGSSYAFEKSDDYSITYKKGHEGLAGDSVVGLAADATYTKTLKRQVTVRRRGSFNARLMLSYYVNN